MEKKFELEEFDEVQLIANETVNRYVDNSQLTEIVAHDYMAKLGAVFVRKTSWMDV